MSNYLKILNSVSLKPGPNTEKYGSRSEYGFLRTGCRPIRMQDSIKRYNNKSYYRFPA